MLRIPHLRFGLVCNPAACSIDRFSAWDAGKVNLVVKVTCASRALDP